MALFFILDYSIMDLDHQHRMTTRRWGYHVLAETRFDPVEFF